MSAFGTRLQDRIGADRFRVLQEAINRAPGGVARGFERRGGEV